MSMSITHTPSVFQKKAKHGTFARKKNGARPLNPYIFGTSVTKGISQAYLYGHTPFCIQKGGKTSLQLMSSKQTFL